MLPSADRAHIVHAADIHVMRTPIGAVDNEVMPVIDFVGQSARHDAADQGLHVAVRRIVDGIVRQAARDAVIA